MIAYKTEIRARYAETDQMQFIHHSVYIVWFEYARVALLREIGWPYDQMERDGFLLPVIEINAQYLKPARFDQLVTVEAKLFKMPRARMRIDYEVVHERDGLLCRGYSVHGFMNKQDRAIRPPHSFMETLKAYF